MDLFEMVTKSLVATDQDRDRSLQTEIGASSIGGCRRQAWHIINQTPKTNTNTENLAAILGTAIHAHLAEAIKFSDPFGDNFLIEQEVRTEDLKGHVDLYIKSAKKVVDWKTITKKKIKDFPNEQQIMQINLYGYLLKANGYEVDTVALVGISRDGTMKDIKVWEESYNEDLALQGLEWLKQVKAMEQPPAPEKDVFFCRNYCSYYDASGVTGCKGN